jgi:N-carbamoylputrescine amidase
VSRVRRIGLVQQAVGDDLDRNLARAEDAIREAAQRGAELVCLQELFRTKYFCQREDAGLFDLAETIPGPTTERLSKVAADCGVVLIVPLFEKRAAGLYHNSAVVIERDGTQLGHYRKMHIPDDPGFYEKFYFTPGDRGFHCVDTSVGRIGVLICWDQWFPEAARLMALDGAELLFYPTAIGYLDNETDEENASMRESWVTVQRGHAIANGLFVCAANRVGREGSLRFWGSSFVADPRGKLIAQADDASETVLVAECDLERIESQRRGWPFLRDRRIDAYGDLLTRFRR